MALAAQEEWIPPVRKGQILFFSPLKKEKEIGRGKDRWNEKDVGQKGHSVFIQDDKTSNS